MQEQQSHKRLPSVRGQHLIALVCFFLSGFAGLVYEVVWIRQASLIFGSTTFAVSAILAVFFLGLACGAYVFGQVGQWTGRPLKLFARIEIALGVLVLMSPYVFDLVDIFYGEVYRALGERTALLFLVRLILVGFVVFPPTFLMGGTLPLFCRQYVLEDGQIARSVGLLYGVNTLGAALGCAAAGFVLLPVLGMRGAVLVGAVLNIFGGLAVGALPIARKEVPEAISSEERDGSHRGVYVLFLAVGFVALGSEVLWTRYLGLLIPNTVYTYTLTLSVVLVGLVLGSVLASWFSDRSTARALYFGALQILTGLMVLGLMMLPPTIWRDLGGDLWIYFLLLLPPSILGGASFPLAVRMVVDDVSAASRATGGMVAVNTVGGILGSLLVGFVGLPFLGLEKSLLFTTGANLAIGCAAWMSLVRGHRRILRLAVVGVALLVWFGIPRFLGTRIPADFLGEGRDLVALREGYGTNMTVVRRNRELQLEMDRWWQGSDRKTHQVMAAHVPMLLNSDPKEVLVVGVGTGQTASRFLMYPIDRLACVDIEPMLFPFIRTHFESEWMDDERVRLIRADGRNYLRHTDAIYDIISLELGEVSRPGVAFFYTTDFYREARERLRPEGFVVQFVPLRFLNEDALRGVVRSFLDVFPQSILWYNTSELMMIGTQGERLTMDFSRLVEGLLQEQVHQDLKYSHWGGRDHWLHHPQVFLGGYLMGPRGLASLGAEGALYRDDRPILDYAQRVQDSANELPVLRVMVDYLEPVAAFLEGEPVLEAGIAEIREKNLREMAARVFIRQAMDLIPTGDHRRIAALCSEALRRHPDYLEAHQMFADALMQLGVFEKAGEHYAVVLEMEPEDGRALDGRAVTLHQLGRLEEAIPHYEAAVRFNPENGLALNGLALALHQLERFEEAVPHYEAALQLRPDRVETLVSLGEVFIQLGRYQEALSPLEKAVRLRPGFLKARRYLDGVRDSLKTGPPHGNNGG